MSKGFVVLAQNSEVNYVRLAYALALSLKITQPSANISIITNDLVLDEYTDVFDNIIPIPWSDSAIDSAWKIENRWKIYHASPYDETIVLDVDMLVFRDLTPFWEIFQNYELYITGKVLDYRNNVITSDYYRKTFTENNLPNLYTGLHYFKKCNFSKQFYEWMELITNNWELFYGKYVSNQYPGRASMDVTAALTSKILDCESKITNYNFDSVSFVHMKPMIQGWKAPTDTWRQAVGAYFNDNCELKIGNFRQYSIFHYTEKEFLTDQMIKKMENKWTQMK